MCIQADTVCNGLPSLQGMVRAAASLDLSERKSSGDKDFSESGVGGGEGQTFPVSLAKYFIYM